MNMKKEWFSTSNIFSAVLIIFAAAMVMSPQVKGWTIQNLMKIGLFQPRIGKIENDDRVPEPLPNILFKDSEGEIVGLQSLKGKVVFINFWATWCPPCIAEMPSISALHDRFGDNKNIVFLMVDVDGNFEKSDNFMKKHQYNLHVMSTASVIPPSFMQGTIPTTIILDKNGDIVFRQEGAADYSNTKLVNMITGLIRNLGVSI
jgi:thiol-disulfide isomerase/thioredoxin